MVKMVKLRDEKDALAIMVMTLAVVPGVPRSAKEKADLEEDLKKMGSQELLRRS